MKQTISQRGRGYGKRMEVSQRAEKRMARTYKTFVVPWLYRGDDLLNMKTIDTVNRLFLRGFHQQNGEFVKK
jgi:hypothetical protein